jgi:hypothetical protein
MWVCGKLTIRQLCHRVTGHRWLNNGRMDTEAGLNAVANRKVFALTGNRITFTLSAYNTCVDWTIPTHNSGSFIGLIIWTSVRVTHYKNNSLYSYITGQHIIKKYIYTIYFTREMWKLQKKLCQRNDGDGTCTKMSYSVTNHEIPWKWALLEKPRFSRLDNKIPCFHKTQRYLIFFYNCLSWTRFSPRSPDLIL